MRVALVSPYSWTYPGGVTRHIEALAGELLAAGHEVRVFAPYDHDTRRAALAHRGARPQPRTAPEWLVELGGTVGWPSNGAVSNLALTPRAVSALHREVRAFGPDVVHLHEPPAPVAGWTNFTEAPMVGTFHCHSTAWLPHQAAHLLGARLRMNRLSLRIAVSEAAAWTARRFYGGRYRIVPNGVSLPAGGVPGARGREPGDPLRIAFVGQAVARKGLPVLLRAFEALRAEAPARLTVVGADEEEVAPLLVERTGVTVLGRVDDAVKEAVLADADVLCAPSLGGESFGMVLTEAFAAGTPVIASDIAGYRDVVTHGGDGLLIPAGDAAALGETLRDLADRPGSTARMAEEAARSAQRYAWPRVADQVVRCYREARAVPEPSGAASRIAVRTGLVPADLGPVVPARRLEPLDPSPPRAGRVARRVGFVAAAGAAAVGGWLALAHIGPRAILDTLVGSSPVWVLAALALMCGSMLLRAVSWQAILRAALPESRPSFGDAYQGTTIGVLMSATLPARLGEPSRALIVARRLGNPRERLPTVLGTIVSQTLFNVLALVILGAVMFSTIGLFAGRQQALVWYALAPIALLCTVLVAPTLLRSGAAARSRLVALARGWAHQIRSGLRVFSRPRLGLRAVVAQLCAWTLQWLACYLLLVALGLEHRADLGAAAAVLFAVNVSAVLPLTPSNLGVFQAACVAVLAGAYGINPAEALGYGIILQAVEVTTAVVMGGPALVKEGLSWREVRLRALHGSPVSLRAREAEA
jgi:phosphatidyl-myo-inositol alpha-mannosyltransferase